MPFAVDGFARTSAWMSAFALSASALSVERDLADAGVDDARLLDAVLDLAGLRFADGVLDVERDRADLGVRHEAARTEDATELTDGAHHVGRRDDAVEVHEAFAEPSPPGRRCRRSRRRPSRASRSFSPLANTSTRTVLTGAVRENDRAADHLIGVLGIDSQAHGEVDRLVELGELAPS